MKRHLLYLLSLLICTISLQAQHNLVLKDKEGRMVAYDIQQQGVMPPALQEILRQHREDQETLLTRGATLHSSASYLLSSIRAQEEPYNLLCPHWKYKDGRVSEERCVSGCVATAIEQVLAYHRYPAALSDSLPGWTTEHYTLVTLPAGTKFDWDNYLLDYRQGWTQEQGMAIAVPTLACGMAVHMNYGLDASGADTERAVEPLRKAFGYPMVRYYNRLLYSPERWQAMVRHEIAHKRPIVYTGYNMPMSGHAFNIDGIDERGYYHVNWGYNGSYDGWYNPDWLDPWEPVQEDSLGIAEGFFCNHYALFLGPSTDDKPLEPDSFQIDSLGVVCEALSFCRQPDRQGQVGMDFTFYNTSQDTITYTYEVLTYLPTDTAIFEQADYIAVSAVNLLPGERRQQRVYGHFNKAGERLIGISHDDITIPFIDTVQIVEGTAPMLEWSEVETSYVLRQAQEPRQETRDEGRVVFTFSVKNQAAAGTAGNLITCCLYAEGEEAEDLRHYRVLALKAQEDTTLTVAFDGLAPQTQYHFLVRCPWAVQARADFVTPDWTGIEETREQGQGIKDEEFTYDLAGRHVSTHSGTATRTPLHLYIQHGQKYIELNR